MLLINKETGILCFSFGGLCLENTSSYNVNSCSIDLKFSPFSPFIAGKKKKSFESQVSAIEVEN